MLFYELTVGDKTYKLRLNTRNIVSLEKQINKGALTIFGNGDTVPSVAEMVAVLNCSLQQYQHNITMNEAYDIFDSWLSEGHTIDEFIYIIIEVYRVSGLFKNTNGESEKNS